MKGEKNPDPTSRMKVKRALKLIGGLIAAIVLPSIFGAWYFLPLAPPLEDGPFRGTPTAAINGREPDQSTPIWGGRTLEVFDSTADGVSAIVQLRSVDGSVQWAIFADGFDPGDVRSVRFTSAHRGLARSGEVRGSVKWTYGHEACYWFITGGGELRDYYYSW